MAEDQAKLVLCPYCRNTFEARRGVNWRHAPEGVEEGLMYCSSKCMQRYAFKKRGERHETTTSPSR